MAEHNTVIGLDVGDKHSHLFVLDNQSAEELESTRIRTREATIRTWFELREPARVVLEVGCHSGWLSRMLVELGHEVLVADPRSARLVMGREQKSDELDAEKLARIGRLDPALLRPVKLRSEQTQASLAVVRSRDALVRSRTLLINHVRGTVKTLGVRLPSCASETFARHEDKLPEPLQPALAPLMDAIRVHTERILALDKVIERRCAEDHPQAQRLQQIAGIGPISSLTYVLTIEEPSRFRKSRQVGAYLGLCQRRWASGEMAPTLGITKSGDAMLRRLLINCAQHILGPFGKDCDLRRWGLKHAAGGKLAKKRAVVAVARKLAVLMHRLWVSGQDYDPLYEAKRNGEAVA